MVEAFRRLPEALGAKLVLLGEGPAARRYRGAGRQAHRDARLCPRPAELARWLASADIYVSGNGGRNIRNFDHRGAGVRRCRLSVLPRAR